MSTETAPRQSQHPVMNGINDRQDRIPGLSIPETIIAFGDTGEFGFSDLRSISLIEAFVMTGAKNIITDMPMGSNRLSTIRPESKGKVFLYSPSIETIHTNPAFKEKSTVLAFLSRKTKINKIVEMSYGFEGDILVFGSRFIVCLPGKLILDESSVKMLADLLNSDMTSEDVPGLYAAYAFMMIKNIFGDKKEMVVIDMEKFFSNFLENGSKIFTQDTKIIQESKSEQQPNG
jgi:hypothetical protein